MDYITQQLNNCNHFSIRLWNSIGGSTLTVVSNPASLRNEIMNKGGYGTGTGAAAYVNVDKTQTAYY